MVTLWRLRLNRSLPVAGGIAAALLAGCSSLPSVGPDYQPPAAQAPDRWHTELTKGLEEGLTPAQTWWEVFNDPILDDLIHRAGQGNRNLRIALARIDEARALRGSARSQWFPTVNAAGTAQATRYSEQTAPVPPGGRRETGYYSVGLEAAWELDLWGRVRRLVESSTANLEATVEDYRDVLVVLDAEVASHYLELRTHQERIQLTQRNADRQRQTLKLTQDRHQFGLAPLLDVKQAELNLARTESTLPTLKTLLAQTINRLNVLTGVTPGTLNDLLAKPKEIPGTPDVVTVGLPADLLRQRPDLRRAERQLAAQTALIGVATADLYPTLFLPGTLSLDAFDPGNLNGSSLAYSFGPSLRWNIFSAGRIRSQIKAEEARTQQALSHYEQTVLLALEEVESAMVAFAQERDRRAFLAQSVAAARKSAELVKDLYRTGLTDFQNVLIMERSLFEEEDLEARSQGQLSVNVIRIYQALGGGWSLSPEITQVGSAAKPAK